MRRTLAMVLAVALFAGVMPTAEAAGPTMKFGADAYSLKAQTNAGVKPDYATIWVGPWNIGNWDGTDAKLAKMRQQGITPVVHLYYWGDDISKPCIRDGCWSSLHGTWKDQEGWNKLTRQLTNHLHKEMGGKPVVVVLESEFNKGNLVGYEPLDRKLAKKADQIDNRYPAAKVVLGLGNWNRADWDTWNRAAAASDAIGIQGMRGITRDSHSHYRDLYEDTLKGAQVAKKKFGKPVFITDIALSSYGGYADHQAKELRQFFRNIDELEKAGVQAMIYRSWKDSKMDTANYYGAAERHWGLVKADKSWKWAASVWVNGVNAERGTTPPFDASFQVDDKTNNWWIETKVSGNKKIVKVEAIVDGKATTLDKQPWGSHAKSFHVKNGDQVKFRATSASGEKDVSKTFTWR